ncbi:hypothetical protein COCVIDRAFT_17591 [Bipolaris victoriae FI3]|uniref:Peptidase S8/S53 domain-containing protein n=1 Tax=Bipolaris victoriae (strain FI3) TaxID=930091 RepID=W7EAM8_BIPV3|nr:hypothetical protein COCVIDRAFT_17591 [Bipolaris victoriae FI3]
MVTDPELLIVFAAGNDGQSSTRCVDTDVYRDRQIMFEQSSKNPLVVGYTFNHRQFARDTLGRVYEPAIDNKDERPVNGRNYRDGSGTSKDKLLKLQKSARVSYSSGRGPTLEGRIKPDVVAPGAGILSARSGKAKNATSSGLMRKQEYIFMTGSSFAAPLVSGMAASLQSALKSLRPIPVTNPKGILIKALIINGARDIDRARYEWKRNISHRKPGPPKGSGWRYETMPAAPDGAQGWGLVDMERSMVSLTVNGGYHTATVTKGSTETHDVPTLPPSAGERVLTVTMCYNDTEGYLIQNRLSLHVDLKPIDLNTKPPRKDANTTPGVDLSSETVKGGFSFSNVQRWSEKIQPSLFSSMQLIVCNEPNSLSPSTDFAVAWALTSPIPPQTANDS